MHAASSLIVAIGVRKKLMRWRAGLLFAVILVIAGVL
jgi:hypothetical protein